MRRLLESSEGDTPELSSVVPTRQANRTGRHSVIRCLVTFTKETIVNVKQMADEIAAISNEMVQDAEKQMTGNKSAGRRVRTASSKLRKICKEIRKLSLDMD